MNLAESILDIPQKEYAPWLLTADDKFQPDVRAQILNLISDWRAFTKKEFNISKVEAKGSLLSKRYNDTSDLDISIYTDLTPEERDSLIKTLPKEQTIIIDGKKSGHPLDFYILAEGETTPIEGLDNLYDLIDNKWVKRSEEYDNELPLDYVDQVCGFFGDACQLSLSNYNSDKVLYQYYSDADPAKQDITPEERQEAMDEKIEDLKRDLDAMRLALHMISAFRSEAYKGEDSTPFKITIEVSSDNPHVTLNEQLCKLLEKLGIRQQLREAVQECIDLLNSVLPKTEQVEEIKEALSKKELISELEDLQQDAAKFSQSAQQMGYEKQAAAAEGKAAAYTDAIDLAQDLSDGVVFRGLHEALHSTDLKAAEKNTIEYFKSLILKQLENPTLEEGLKKKLLTTAILLGLGATALFGLGIKKGPDYSNWKTEKMTYGQDSTMDYILDAMTELGEPWFFTVNETTGKAFLLVKVAFSNPNKQSINNLDLDKYHNDAEAAADGVVKEFVRKNFNIDEVYGVAACDYIKEHKGFWIQSENQKYIYFIQMYEMSPDAKYWNDFKNAKTKPELPKEFKESQEKSVAFTFARMNPITKGHIETVVKTLAEQKGEKRIYLSHTQDKKGKKDPLKNKNPLAYEDKLRFARLAVQESYPEVQVMDSDSKTVIAVLCELYNEGFNKITFVVGSDRIDDFEALISKYNGMFSEDNVGYEFDQIRYICAGERIDDGDDIQAMSASKLRKLAVENNLQAFTAGSPFKNEWIAEEEFNLIRDAML